MFVSAKPDPEAFGRKVAKMGSDAFKVGRRQRRRTAGGRLSATIARPISGLAALLIDWTVDRANRRSPLTPSKYITASMIAQARLQPSIPIRTDRTSAPPASVAAS